MAADLRSVSCVEEVSQGLRDHAYLPDDALATAVYLALRLRRPLLLEGEPGVGKTEVAKVIADWGGGRLIRLQCYEGIDAAQAVYEWDYARQLMHLRTMEATGRARGADEDQLADELYNERFLVRRPLLEAIEAADGPPPVLLVDEVDRSDDEFEAYPARGPVGLLDNRPRDRHLRRGGPAGGGHHLQPHPRRARRPQAPLPVPLGGPSRPAAGGGHNPPAGAGGD